MTHPSPSRGLELLLGALLGVFWLLFALLVSLLWTARVAFAHDPSECVCPPCLECAIAPSPEQVQAVQRALDAIEAVEAMDAPVVPLAVPDSPVVGPVAP